MSKIEIFVSLLNFSSVFTNNTVFAVLEIYFFKFLYGCTYLIIISMASNSDDVYTKRIDAPRQDLSDAYSLPANFLEIEVINPETHGVGWRQKYTDYEVKMKVTG